MLECSWEERSRQEQVLAGKQDFCWRIYCILKLIFALAQMKYEFFPFPLSSVELSQGNLHQRIQKTNKETRKKEMNSMWNFVSLFKFTSFLLWIQFPVPYFRTLRRSTSHPSQAGNLNVLWSATWFRGNLIVLAYSLFLNSSSSSYENVYPLKINGFKNEEMTKE